MKDPTIPEKKTDDKKKKLEEENDLSDEDRQLMEDLDMLVSRLSEADVSLHLPALESLRVQIRSSTTSMTSVPKPLKFLRKHYDLLKDLYPKMSTEESQRFTADIISILAMTMPPEKYGNIESLKYRLLGSREEIGSWGHEYVRHLAGEISYDWDQKETTPERKEILIELVKKIIPYNMDHNAEAEACDLLMEIERLDLIDQYVTQEDICNRVCLYLSSCVAYVPDPENTNLLKTCMALFKKFNRYCEAMRNAMQLQDVDEMRALLDECTDPNMKKQLSYMIGRQQVFLGDGDYDVELTDIMSNTHLNSHFLSLARELDIMEPKSPEDIYKSHLETNNRFGSGNIDSARANLASSFVNGLVNCAFGKDKLLLVEDGNKWLYKNKDHGMMSATASLGLMLLWDVDSGLTQIDKYLYSSDDNIKAGALLACGLVNTGVRNDCDPALALLGEYVTGNTNSMKIGSILGLGLAYAGTNREDVISVILPGVVNAENSIEVIGISALACGLISVGTKNQDVTTTCLQAMMDNTKLDLKTEVFAKFVPLAIGLSFLGKQEEIESIDQAMDSIPNVQLKNISKLILEVCAYAGTGNVLKIQKLLHICSEKLDEDKDEVPPPPKGSKPPTKAANASQSSNLQQSIATIGLALITMGEDIGPDMANRMYGHLLRYGDTSIKRAVPLGLGLLSVSNPKLPVLEMLSKFSHDADSEVACNSIMAMGLLGAGTNNARLATMLRQLAQYHVKEANCLFMTRIAQGLAHMGKGTLTLSPFHSDRQLMVPTALAGLVSLMFAFLDVKQTILGKSHYLLYLLTPAIQPRMLVTFNEDLQPLPVAVRVGQAVDVVGQAGKPKTITGFQTHTTPVLLALGERAELATEEYIPITPILEGFVILKKNPNYDGGLI